MKLLFVKSKLIGSRLIRWGLDEQCSHFAIAFEELGIVFESTLLGGAKIVPIVDFLATHQVVHMLQFSYTQDYVAILKSMIEKYLGERYDIRAFLYWCKCVLARKLFGKPFPDHNRWAKDGYNMCTELADGIEWIHLWAKLTGVDLEMVGPETLYYKLVKTGNFHDIPLVSPLDIYAQ